MQTNAQPFILMAQPRTGSSTLVKLLNVHPDINCYHEPFNHEWGIAFDPTYFELFPSTPPSEHQIADPESLSTDQHWVCAYSEAVFDAVLDTLYRQHTGIKQLFKVGQREEAQQVFQQALQRNPQNPYIQSLLGHDLAT